MVEFPSKYNFNNSEKKWQEYWQKHGVYLWDKNERRDKTYVVDTPPPTVSGQLHIGHVYSYTHTDFIVRYQRMKGMNIFYPMGFDDNGLPTERLVEAKRKVRASSMNREEFIAICQDVVEVEEAKFHDLFNRIALSVDWNIEYRTISPVSCKISQMSFLDLIHKNQIYRDSQPMLWDPVDQTALAQADIEDHEKKNNILPKIIKHFRENKKEIQLGQIDNKRDFVDVRDIAKMYELVCFDRPNNQNLINGNEFLIHVPHKYLIESIITTSVDASLTLAEHLIQKSKLETA